MLEVKKTYRYPATILFVVIAASSVLLAGRCSAEYRLHSSPFDIVLSPFVTVQEEYNDNIYLSRLERSDWITTVSPGINMMLSHPRGSLADPETGQKHFLRLTYSPGFVYFLHNPQHDYTSHFQELEAGVNLSPRATFSLKESYIRTNEPELDEIVGVDQKRHLRSDLRFITNRFLISPRMEYRFGSRNSVSVSYRYSAFRSEDPEEDDYNEQDVYAELLYWFNISNGMKLGFNFSKGNFDIQNDLSEGYEFTARFFHSFSPKFEVYVEGNAGFLDYEKIETFDSEGCSRLLDSDDEDIYRSRLGFVYSPFASWVVQGSFGYFWQDGYRGNDEDGFDAMLGVTKKTNRLEYTLKLMKGYEVENFTLNESGSYRTWEVSADVKYRYSPRLEFNLIGSWGYRDYSRDRSAYETAASQERQSGEEEYIYRTRFLASYLVLKNLKLELEYRHDEVDSNRYEEYYIVNHFIGRITVNF